MAARVVHLVGQSGNISINIKKKVQLKAPIPRKLTHKYNDHLLFAAPNQVTMPLAAVLVLGSFSWLPRM